MSMGASCCILLLAAWSLMVVCRIFPTVIDMFLSIVISLFHSYPVANYVLRLMQLRIV